MSYDKSYFVLDNDEILKKDIGAKRYWEIIRERGRRWLGLTMNEVHVFQSALHAYIKKIIAATPMTTSDKCKKKRRSKATDSKREI